MARHPSREDLIKAARSGSHALDTHFETCSECRSLFQLFSRYRVQGEPPLPGAPDDWVRKAQAVGKNRTVRDRLKQWVARLTFDSWAGTPALGMRGTAIDERRLRFDTESVCFDLRAERRGEGWQFIGKIVSADEDPETYRLRVGRRVIAADEAGYFTWSSKTPPGKFTLETEENSVAIEDISWKRPRQ